MKNPKFEKFQKLWTGDCSVKNGDESSADEALMCWLARELKKDVAKMEQYFGASVLGQREKWRNAKITARAPSNSRWITPPLIIQKSEMSPRRNN